MAPSFFDAGSSALHRPLPLDQLTTSVAVAIESAAAAQLVRVPLTVFCSDVCRFGSAGRLRYFTGPQSSAPPSFPLCEGAPAAR